MRDTYICINNKESSLQYFLFIYKINAFSLSICVAVFLCHLVGWREWENLYIQTPRLMIIKIKRVYWVIRFCCCFLTWIGRRVAKAANGIKPTTSEFLFYWLELISKFYFLFFLRWADEAFKDADWRQERTWPLTNLFSMKNESPDSSHRPFYYVSFKSNQSE